MIEPNVVPMSKQLWELTYSSVQHTCCAVCGQDKHTPLRRDEMGGYVCLTCIDHRLDEVEAAEDALEPKTRFALSVPPVRPDLDSEFMKIARLYLENHAFLNEEDRIIYRKVIATAFQEKKSGRVAMLAESEQVCPICGRVFPSLADYFKHYNQEHVVAESKSDG
jgi:hypothetical protein